MKLFFFFLISGLLVFMPAATASASPQNRLNRANQLLSEDKFDQAIELCRETIYDLDSDSPFLGSAVLLLNNCGVKLASLNKVDRALDVLKEAFEYKDDNLTVILNIADLQKKQGNSSDSLDSLETAVSLAETLYAEAGSEAGSEAEESEKASALAAAASRLSGIYYRLAVLYSEKKDYSEAVYNFEKLIDIEPDNYNALFQMGKCLYDSGMLEEALDKMKQAKELALKKKRGSEAVNIDTWVTKIDKELKVVKDFSQDQTNHFRVSFDCEKKYDLVGKVLEICEDAYSRIGYKMGYYPAVQSRITIYDPGQYYTATGLPPWSGGAAYKNSLIRLPLWDALADEERTRRVIFHEYTHLIFHYLTGGKQAPLWLNEGAAQYNSEKRPSERSLFNLQHYLLKNKYVDLKDMEGTWNHYEDPSLVDLVYTTAFLAFIYIVEDIGKYEYFLEMLALYSKGYETDRVLKNILGMTYPEFRHSFKVWLLEYSKKHPGSSGSGQQEAGAGLPSAESKVQKQAFK
jgi:tetratricopeptide (TPR) repeat protein